MARITATHWTCMAMLVGMVFGVVISSTPVVCFCGFTMVCGQVGISVGELRTDLASGRAETVRSKE